MGSTGTAVVLLLKRDRNLEAKRKRDQAIMANPNLAFRVSSK